MKHRLFDAKSTVYPEESILEVTQRYILQTTIAGYHIGTNFTFYSARKVILTLVPCVQLSLLL